MLFRRTVLAASLALVVPAMAGPTSSHVSEGAEISLIVLAAEDGEPMRGLLRIELQPGWKTYWRDPGGSGVPPSVTVDGMESEIHFPAPTWIEDAYSTFAGYDRSVDLPLTISASEGFSPGQLSVDYFLGVCRAICIPVQGQFEVRPGEAGEAEKHAVAEAFAALPAGAGQNFGIELVEKDPLGITLEASLPEEAYRVELFVAGEADQPVGMPRRLDDQSRILFFVPLEDASASPQPVDLPYTLTADDSAVSGTISLDRR